MDQNVSEENGDAFWTSYLELTEHLDSKQSISIKKEPRKYSWLS